MNPPNRVSVINELFNDDVSSWVHSHPITITRHLEKRSHISTFADVVTGHISSTKSHLVVASMNVNTLSIPKLDYVLDRMNFHNIDVFLLQDTRHKEDVTPLYSRHSDNYWKSYSSDDEGTVGSVVVTSPVKDSSQPGGQMILCRPQWGRLLFDWGTDKTKLGLYIWADFSLKGRKIRIISTYFPPRSTKKDGIPVGSLAFRIKQYASSHSIPGNPTEVVRHLLGQILLPCIKRRTPYIIAGDFNEKWSNPDFKAWASSLGLSNFLFTSCPSPSKAAFTFQRLTPTPSYTHIDHILHQSNALIIPTFSVSLSG